MDNKYLFKIVFLGPSSSGAKTSLVFRIVENKFNKETIPTIGVDFKFYRFKTKYGIANLQIWDTSG